WTCRGVLTGYSGPKALQTLATAGIEVIPNCSGTVRETLEKFRQGQLSSGGLSDGCAPAQSPTNRGTAVERPR
ncbi:MAG TPA: hypothetical protein EYP14_11645, partial [Planctomycetaceae bacterium]|nr:hypothetical protein [Planctomycetaceae bacterium]